MTSDKLIIAGKIFNSRLFTGTGKFSSPILMEEALRADGFLAKSRLHHAA